MPLYRQTPDLSLAPKGRLRQLQGLGLMPNMQAVTRVDLIRSNLSAFARRYLSLREARQTIDLTYYIWREDTSGVLLLDELLNAADRGVRVRILLDSLNFSGPGSLFIGLNQHPNIEVRLYSTFHYGYLSPMHKFVEFCLRAYKLNRRLHIKCWTVDENFAICGGRNIGDEYFGNKTTTNFSDIDIGLRGSAATQFTKYFEEYWTSHYTKKLERIRGLQPTSSFNEFRRELAKRRKEADQTQFAKILAERLNDPNQGTQTYDLDSRNLTIIWDPPAKVLFKPRVRRAGTTVDEVFKLISSAKKELNLISPYFVPGPKGSGMLVAAAQSNKKIGILTNSLAATDAIAAHSGVVKYRKVLLENNVRIFELKPLSRLRKRLGILPRSRSSLHAKFIISDKQKVFVGSFNIDPRSAWLNCEAGVLIDHGPLAHEMFEMYREYTAPENSWEIKLRGSRLVWVSFDDNGVEVCLDSEPEATLGKRILVWLFSLLPIEPLL